jgi:predicted aspartyl protease
MPHRFITSALFFMHFALASHPALAAPSREELSRLAARRLPSVIHDQPTVVPFVLYNGHLYVEVMIDGQGPFNFIFDSGALNVLSPSTAEKLGLSSSGNVEASGTGGTQSATVTKVDLVQIGGASLRDQKFYVVDLPPSVGEGRVVDGLLGFEWLSRFPTRIDYTASTLSFFARGAPELSGSAKPTKLLFRGRLPQIEAKLDGIVGRFSIDTGSNGSLILYPGFATANSLVSRYNAKTEIMSSVGVGGPVYSLTTRAGELSVAGHIIRKPVTFLPRTQTGASADAKTAGNIGSGVLRRFTLTLDYPRSQIYFEPNEAFADTDLADRSGLRVNAAPGGFIVVFVVDGSAAARAGLIKNDVIVAIDGYQASSLDLATLRAKLKGPEGTKVEVALASGKLSTLVLQNIE